MKTRTIVGALAAVAAGALKSLAFSSSETPNITKPSTQFSRNSVPGLKFSRIRSMSAMDEQLRFDASRFPGRG